MQKLNIFSDVMALMDAYLLTNISAVVVLPKIVYDGFWT